MAEDEFATPLHIQRLEKALRLEPLLNYMENVINTNNDSDLDSAGTETDGESVRIDDEGNHIYNGIVVSKAERKADKNRLYNFTKVKKGRKWLKNALLSDSSSGEDDPTPGPEDVKSLLEIHNYQRGCRTQFYEDPEHHQFQYYSTGLLSSHDKFNEHQKSILGPKKRAAKEQKKLEKKIRKAAKMRKLHGDDGGEDRRQASLDGDDEREDGELTYEEIRLQQMLYGEEPQQQAVFHNVLNQPTSAKLPKNKRLTQEQLAAKRRRIWVAMSKKEIPKAAKQKMSVRKEGMLNLKKVCKETQKETRRKALASQKVAREGVVRARRLAKEAQAYWKRYEKVEKEHRKKAEKEAIEQRKVDLENQESKRQQRKLNFLITQTELYAHFMAKKLTGDSDDRKEAILMRLDEFGESGGSNGGRAEVSGGALTNVNQDDYDAQDAKEKVLRTADIAFRKHREKTEKFDKAVGAKASASSIFANPKLSGDSIPQPSILQCKLKGYQMTGLNWLASLYNQGINGILADEMGLGKTVQSIAFLAHLAECHGIWGPFLVVAPSSTLHNWQQEITKFMPAFKVVPYWGNTADRRVLRKFWNSDQPYHEKEASFHVVITSYQLLVGDAKYFHRMKWHYMVLDEAQAIKSVTSVRWKMLLQFNCRNRLLLTGTPIQNSMQELWALLHYIMPTLFDSHEEFNDWFSKDIENHAERQSGIDEKHLSRLHMILKPFMLRRCKKDVENELSDKIEVIVHCPLTKRQRYLYQALINKIRIEDLQTIHISSDKGSAPNSLMNLVMQCRKVCNHPELFERREVRSPMHIILPPYIIPKLIYREGYLEHEIPSKRHILYKKLCLFHPHNIHTALNEGGPYSFFSFSRFLDLSVGEVSGVMLGGLLYRWLHLMYTTARHALIHHKHTHHTQHIIMPSRCMNRTSFLLEPIHTTSAANVASSPILRQLVFTSPTSTVHSHGTVTLHYMKESVAHLKIRVRHKSSIQREGETAAAASIDCKSPPAGSAPRTKKLTGSPTKALKNKAAKMEESVHQHTPRPPRHFEMMPIPLPHFLYSVMPKAFTAGVLPYTSDRSAAWSTLREQYCGTLEGKQSLLYGTPQHYWEWRARRSFFQTVQPQGINGIQPKHGYSLVSVPDKETMISDAGKLYVLDTLLDRLKQEGHRVLIYSQMTRMIDLLEEYMWHRKHTYKRLDGSSKISERRDMVNDFQANSDIFVFLLSTRAGGLGINLTAADTVIFYDSDWNPTVDQQAMDRAHRLGQTKQVTVYRLICKGTIEERMIQRASEKSEIQKMVIEGGDVRPDVLKPKEMMSLLLDDDEIGKKLKKKFDEDGFIDYGHTKKRKVKSGRGPGRPPKVRKVEEEPPQQPVLQHQTIPAPSFFDDIANSRPSSAMSESTHQSIMAAAAAAGGGGGADDSSNDGLVIVDDAAAHATFAPPVGSSSSSVRGVSKPRGRPRGRPRGSTSSAPRRSRGRGSIQKAIAAAESAAIAAGKTAAFAQYGYTFESDPTRPATPSTRGRGGRGRGGLTTRGAKH